MKSRGIYFNLSLILCNNMLFQFLLHSYIICECLSSNHDSLIDISELHIKQRIFHNIHVYCFLFSLDMSIPITWYREGFSTIITFVIFLSLMCYISWLWYLRFPTRVTFIVLLFFMSFWLGEAFSTIIVISLSFMYSQSHWLLKTFATNIATRFFPLSMN